MKVQEHVAAVALAKGLRQSTVISYERLIGRLGWLDREMSDVEVEFRDQADYISKYRRVLDHFDAMSATGPRMGGGRDKSGSASGAPRQRPAKHSGGSFTGRMEDRFRRRFDQ